MESRPKPSSEIPRARNLEKAALPMDERRQEVVECVRNNNNAVIIGETGSGKSTRIPVFLLDALPKAKIAITQPRRVAARSVARYVAEQRGGRIGDEIGYQVRFEDKTTEGTRANFMTEGILLRKMQSDPLLEEYDVVMVDEAHERSLNIDFVLGLLKRIQRERVKVGKKQLKVLATSATIEKEKFSNYFEKSPVVEVAGRMFPVDVKYEKSTVRDYILEAAEKVREIVQGGAEGDVLIFMPGKAEIQQTIKQIESLGIKEVEVLPLYGAMASEDQDKIFLKSAKRKIIVATNIAETSVTIDGVRFVVDSGLIKQKEFNPVTGIEALTVKQHAKSGCEQRKGRAGRTAPGVCYRLYTEQDYQNLPDFQTPEIARSNLDHVILAMKNGGIEDVRGFDFIDRPSESAISQAVETLKMLGALDDQEKLTAIGKVMAELPLRPEISRMVLEAEKHHCVGKICTIAAMLGDKSIFARPKGKEHEADTAHNQFAKEGSDFLRLLEIGRQWSAAGFSEGWAIDHYLNVRQLFEVREIRSQLMRVLRKRGVPVDDANGNDPVEIQKCIAAGLIQHLMAYSGKFAYERVVQGTEQRSDRIYIHPSSTVFSMKPELMIGADVMRTSKTYARSCQPVDPTWLPEIAPQLLREYDKSFSYDPEQDSVIELSRLGLKGRSSPLVEQRRIVKDHEKAAEVFMKALVEGKVDLPCVERNNEAMELLHSLYVRSGGMIKLPVIGDWYKEKAGGCVSKKEAAHIDEQMRINIEDFCPLETLSEINASHPETVEIKGVAVRVSYDYRLANPNGWLESEKVEKFTATLNIPVDLVFSMTEEDAPSIGATGRPAILYKSGEGYNVVVESLAKLKEAMDKKRLDEAWYNFRPPETLKIKVEDFFPLPTVEELGARPVVIAKNHRGEEVFVMPGINILGPNYDYDKREYKYEYGVRYFRTNEAAANSTERAIEQKTQDDARKQRKIDREQFLAPAKEQYAVMQDTMKELLAGYREKGFSYDERSELERQYNEARSVIESPDADPKKALQILESIRAAIAERSMEIERRLKRAPEVQKIMDGLADKIERIDYNNYARFGLSYEQYSALRNKWSEAVNALKVEDPYGRPVLLDPDKSETLFQELEAELPEEQEFTPEQEMLVDILSGRNSGYAKIIRVRGGRVAEAFSPGQTSDIAHAPDEIAIGGSGRELLVKGSRLVFVYGSGREGERWKLTDGDYLFSRDAGDVFKVEEKTGAPYGWRAISRVETFYDVETSYDNDATYRAAQSIKEEMPERKEGLAAGVFATLLGKISGKEAQTAKAVPKEERHLPKSKTEEREKMTSELRNQFGEELSNARFLWDIVNSIPDAGKKDPNASKIAKLKARIKEAKKELGAFAAELAKTDDASYARGKVADLVRRAESAGKEFARLSNKNEDWPSVLRQCAARVKEIAKEQEVEIDDPTWEKIRVKLASFSQQKNIPEDLDAELESILIDSL